MSTRKTQRKSLKHDALNQWLMHPGAPMYFGREFRTKLKVLAHLLSGQNTIAGIARSEGVTRQAAHKHLVRARRAFGICQPGS
jgi:hypothetical protein